MILKKIVLTIPALIWGWDGFCQGRDSISYFDPHLNNFDPHEVVQFFRPLHEDGYINNPHKGTTSFQRLAGDDLYPGLQWDDSKAPMTFEKATAPLKEIKNYITYC